MRRRAKTRRTDGLARWRTVRLKADATISVRLKGGPHNLGPSEGGPHNLRSASRRTPRPAAFTTAACGSMLTAPMAWAS